MARGQAPLLFATPLWAGHQLPGACGYGRSQAISPAICCRSGIGSPW
jgi:hypothetical protein